MDRDEFQKIVDEVTGGEHYPAVRENKAKGIKGQKSYCGPTVTLKQKWITGGEWGGNCWSDERSNYGPTPYPEPEFNDLDRILEKIAPSMRFLEYKNLMSKVKYSDHTEYEYYGNYTSYGIKELKVDDIWDFLKEKGYV